MGSRLLPFLTRSTDVAADHDHGGELRHRYLYHHRHRRPGGSITPAGATSVVTTATTRPSPSLPDVGYEVAEVLVDGVSAWAAPSSYDFTNVTADHTIEATCLSINELHPGVTGVG